MEEKINNFYLSIDRRLGTYVYYTHRQSIFLSVVSYHQRVGQLVALTFRQETL